MPGSWAAPATGHVREHNVEIVQADFVPPAQGEVATRLLFISRDSMDLRDQNGTVPGSLTNLPHERLCPGSEELQRLRQGFR